MMKKKSVYANITPIPSHIPRQLAIDMLHSHREIIELNPLVIDLRPIKAPQNAPADEYFSTWYEIDQRIQFVPGIGKAGAGKISFKGCFHDMPWGLQTHVYPPMGIEIRNKWQIRGNQPGEPPEHKELGSGAPAEGLYLREDIEITCNRAMMQFTKNGMKEASKVMVDRLVKKAELIDSGVLSAMMEDGKLKTLNPADRSRTFQQSGQYSPGLMSPATAQFGPGPRSPGFPPSMDRNYVQSANQSAYGRQSQYYGGYAQDGRQIQNASHVPPPQGLAIEMDGSSQFAPQQHQNQNLQPPNRFSTAVSELSASSPPANQTLFPNGNASDRQSYAGSVSSHPTSYDPDGSMASPGLDKRSFAVELPGSDSAAPNRSMTPQGGTSPDPNGVGFAGGGTPGQQYRYNPLDYARMSS
ncbi:uncharacterized protein PV06_05725 [Exophiala oligosperma]|uniref:DUF7053 domain-containing protein n=1 Tax=Exophiala oligosperma TaxID=215243 RepID=A0A0D2BXA0_9EURO|nr:uncharacterized protein PV06_05725 [Exophiala oligosperma]KIW42142.1 hypothetical protein PV06_05725 [Exophiala oligosperma]